MYLPVGRDRAGGRGLLPARGRRSVAAPRRGSRARCPSPCSSSSGTITRNTIWESDDALFTNLVLTSPDSAKAHYDYGYASADRKRFRPAYDQYAIATGIYAHYHDAWAGRGGWPERSATWPRPSRTAGGRSRSTLPTRTDGSRLPSRPSDAATRRRPTPHTATASGAARRPIRPRYHRAVFLFRMGRLDEAVEAYRRAITLAPDMALESRGPRPHLLGPGWTEKAEEEWDAALDLFPTDGVALSGGGANRRGEAVTTTKRRILGSRSSRRAAIVPTFLGPASPMRRGVAVGRAGSRPALERLGAQAARPVFRSRRRGQASRRLDDFRRLGSSLLDDILITSRPVALLLLTILIPAGVRGDLRVPVPGRLIDLGGAPRGPSSRSGTRAPRALRRQRRGAALTRPRERELRRAGLDLDDARP